VEQSWVKVFEGFSFWLWDFPEHDQYKDGHDYDDSTVVLESNGSMTLCYLRWFSRLTSLVYIQGFRVDLKGMSCACYGEGMYRGCNPS
jgi:hypothetical protein